MLPHAGASARATPAGHVTIWSHVLSPGSRSFRASAQCGRNRQSRRVGSGRKSSVRGHSEIDSENRSWAHYGDSVSRQRMRAGHGLRVAADRIGAGKDCARGSPAAAGRIGAGHRGYAGSLYSRQSPGDGRAGGGAQAVVRTRSGRRTRSVSVKRPAATSAATRQANPDRKELDRVAR